MAVRRDFPLIIGPGFKVSLNRPLPHVLKLGRPCRAPEIARLVRWCRDEPGLDGFFQCKCTVWEADIEVHHFPIGGYHAPPNARYDVIFRFSLVTSLQAFSYHSRSWPCQSGAPLQGLAPMLKP
jgi:hypothetical protein